MGVKNLSLGLAIAGLGLACSTPPPVASDELPADAARLAVVMDLVDQRVLGEVLLESKGDASGFDILKYRKKLEALKSRRPEELKASLKDFEVQTLDSYEKTFVLCIYSRKKQLAMCDDSRCSGIEKKAIVKNEHAIQELKVGLPLNSCPVQ